MMADEPFGEYIFIDAIRYEPSNSLFFLSFHPSPNSCYRLDLSKAQITFSSTKEE